MNQTELTQKLAEAEQRGREKEYREQTIGKSREAMLIGLQEENTALKRDKDTFEQREKDWKKEIEKSEQDIRTLLKEIERLKALLPVEPSALPHKLRFAQRGIIKDKVGEKE